MAENYTPTPVDEALMGHLLTTQVVSAIQQAHVDGKIDQETYSALFEIAQKAERAILTLAEHLEVKPWGSDIYTGELRQADHSDSSESAWWNPGE